MGEDGRPDDRVRTDLAMASARKLAAKRINERLKLLANLLNSLAIGVIGAGVIVPAVRDPSQGTLLILTWQMLTWITIGLALHLVGQSVFAFMRSED